MKDATASKLRRRPIAVPVQQPNRDDRRHQAHGDLLDPSRQTPIGLGQKYLEPNGYLAAKIDYPQHCQDGDHRASDRGPDRTVAARNLAQDRKQPQGNRGDRERQFPAFSILHNRQVNITKLRSSSRLCVAGALLLVSACKTPGIYPPRQDLIEVTEKKPTPGADILTDPAAGDRYDSAIEGWGDRVRAAGMRLCRFYGRTGMKVLCERD